MRDGVRTSSELYFVLKYQAFEIGPIYPLARYAPQYPNEIKN